MALVRISAAIVALGLQAVILGLLFQSFRSSTPHPKIARESVLQLPRLIEPPSRPRTIDARRNPAPGIAPPVFIPPSEARRSPPAIIAPPDMRSLGRALNGCAPEIFASLTQEQRAACARPGDGVAMLEVPSLMNAPSHVKDEARWTNELARRNSGLLMPCTTTIAGAPGFNFICLGHMYAEGNLTDPHDWPIYRAGKIPPEDFAKIERAYAAWRQQHQQSHLAAAH